ncbi:MAG: hypothetical protein ORN51_01240 [Akkermansiaceae bacterium]|nr:hypothetical protein [Akkermansiaceae bacterium]
MKRKVPIINSKTWNAMIDDVSRRLPLRFMRMSRRWVHPWTIMPEWSDVAGQWVFRIRPGFINGVEPEISTTAMLASERTLDRIEEETGTRPDKKQSVDALITESPQILVPSTRIIGKGADAEAVSISESGDVKVEFEGVPEFFIQFGVSDEKVVFQGNLNSGIQEVQYESAGESPRLRACDVVLYVDRAAAKLDTIQGNPFLDGYSALLVINYGRSSPARERPWLNVTAKYKPIVEADLGNLVEGTADPEFDAIKIATIYFLSPPKFSPELPMDDTWTAFVKHDQFWNLCHAPQKIPDSTPIDPIRLQTGLVGGIADPIFSSLLAPGNDAYNTALQVLRNRNLAGRFWSL